MMAMQAAPKCVVEQPESDPSGEIGGEGSDDDDDDVPPLEPLEDCEGDRSEQEESADETIDDEGAESDEMEHSEDMECSEEEEHREDPAPKTPDLKTPEDPPREWNELFFQTPPMAIAGPTKMRLYCMALMQFWACHHPHILKTLVVCYYQKFNLFFAFFLWALVMLDSQLSSSLHLMLHTRIEELVAARLHASLRMDSRYGVRASAWLAKPSFFDTWLARSQATGEWKVLLEKI